LFTTLGRAVFESEVAVNEIKESPRWEG